MKSFGKDLSDNLSLLLLGLIFIIGFLLRVSFPEFVGLSSDEIASMYFAHFPGKIFESETHPPLFYLFLKPFVHVLGPYSLRVFMGFLSTTLICWALFLSRGAFSWKGTTILGILLFLSPADIFAARIIRHYGLFIELTAVLFLLVKVERPGWQARVIGTILSCLHPLGWVPWFVVVCERILLQKKISKQAWIDLLLFLPVTTWYIAKLIFIGDKGFFTHFGAPVIKYTSFPVDLFNILAGEHYPRINFFPLSKESFYITVGLVGITFAGAAWLKWRKVKLNFILPTILTIGIALAFGWVFSLVAFDIMNGRYFLFLLAPFYLLASELFERVPWSPIFLSCILLVNLIWIRPFQIYESDRELYQFGMDYKTREPEREFVFCGNQFQWWYYRNASPQDCLAAIDSLRISGKAFVLVDMSIAGFWRSMSIFPELEIDDYRVYSFTGAVVGRFRKGKM